MNKAVRLWAVFVAAAAVFSAFVSPTAGVGILGGMAFFLWTERDTRNRWASGSIAIGILLAVVVLARLVQDYIGGGWLQALGWMVAACLFAEGVKWVGSTPRRPQQPPE